MAVESPFRLTTANFKITLNGQTTVTTITDISFKFDPKATILHSATHERLGVYWGPSELTVDVSAYAADSSDTDTALWTILKYAQTREFVSVKIEISGENTDIFLRSIDIPNGVITAITPIKVGTDGVQTLDFTITAMEWTMTSRDGTETVTADSVDPDGIQSA